MRTTWWSDVLGRQGMPKDEIGAILAARDPAVVRQHLELHRERLQEELALRRRVVERIEQWLMSRRQAPYERADVGRATPIRGLRR